jgi:hypothetical protein
METAFLSNNIIFSIEKLSMDNIVHYVFIGNVEEKIKNILSKLENRKTILKEEVSLLRDSFRENYKNWIDIVVRDRKKIVFILNKIQIDDTLNEIRRKIYIYISDYEKKEFILPENQLLWVINEKEEKEIIGYNYENSTIKEKINLIPNVFAKISESNISKYQNILSDNNNKINTSENNMVIIDLKNIINFKNNTIYLVNAIDENYYLKKTGQQKEQINNLNAYFKIFWPFINLNFNLQEIKNNYLLTKELLEKESYIFNLIKNNNDEKIKDKYGLCINTIQIEVNNKKFFNNKNNINKINNQIIDSNQIINSNKIIDLYQIFDFMIDHKIDKKTPYIKYTDDIIESSFSIISKEALDNNLIKKDELKRWLGIVKEKTIKKNGITFKRYLKDYLEKPRYSSIFLNKYGELSINVSFNTEINADFNDIENTIKDCKKIIEDINRNKIISKINEKVRINTPDMDIIDNKIVFKKNTKIVFMNIAIPIKYNNIFDFKKLLDFSFNFPSFLSEFPKDDVIEKQDLTQKYFLDESKSEKGIKLKFRRISGFANMNEILKDIDILKEKDESDIKILKILEFKYKKNIEELKKYLLEWKRKYSLSKSTKIDSKFKFGITATITNQNIKIDGITKLYQIPIIYNFFTTFITLFNNYESFIHDDKIFKKYFSGKNINNEFKILQENTYEINQNALLNIDNFQLYNTNELFLEENINEINKTKLYIEENTEYDKNYEKEDKYVAENLKNKGLGLGTGLGIANNSEIDISVRLDCNDAIPEIGTCKDFCNDSNYFIRRLQKYDNKLFKFSGDEKNKRKRYSIGCQRKTQPVVLPYDPITNSKIDNESYTSVLKYGSDEEHQRWYMCPKIWCPYCEIPIAEKLIDPKTIRKRTTKDLGSFCTTAKCPYGDHQVFMREEDKKIEIGFLDASFHPEGLCLPCCYIKSQSNPLSSGYTTYKKCLGEEVENINIKDGQTYILGKGIPIEKDRYGKLSFDIAKILNTSLETGYLSFKSGYVRKGIKHEINNSFLCAIADIISCDKNNSSVDLLKLKKILIEKLNEPLFRSLYNGNLVNIFFNPKSGLSTIDNFKNYIVNKKIIIDHKYLWDYLQRDNILYENGINIFIFEDNNLICPMGENIKDFYNIEKKSILLIKYKEYYEPIYFLEGEGKTSKKTCFFDINKVEIKKLYEISCEGCKSTFIDNIDWIAVLKDNIQKYDIKIDNITLNNGENLQIVLNQLLTNIKNKKLDSSYLPILQYIDSYNKVIGLKLKNNLYYPINPSKLIPEIKYKLIYDLKDIDVLYLTETLKFYKTLEKNTNLKCRITHKIFDMKNNKYINAIVNEYNRFIPIKKSLDKNNTLKISNLNYYSDVDLSLYDKIEMIDKRIEQNNKKNFEDETYIRIKFELSKILQLKENKNILTEIDDLINSHDNNITKKREIMYNILNKIFKDILIIKDTEKDYYNYSTPNKRIPCFLRSNKSNKNNKKNGIKLLCEDDPHCIKSNYSCKLFLNKKNLLNIHKNLENYNYYISMIIDELLRYRIKRDEILQDNIPIIINKNKIKENLNKYIVIHTLDLNEINNTVERLFLDNKGLFIDNRSLYEENSTRQYGFSKNKYIKSDVIELYNYKLEEIPVYWKKILGDMFKYKNIEENIFTIVVNILNREKHNILNQNKNQKISIYDVKKKITDYLKYMIFQKKLDEETIMNLYKECGDKIFKYITSFQSLLSEILNESYEGTDIDLKFLSKIYKINFILLNKRIKKDENIFKIFSFKNNISKKNENLDNEKYVLIFKSLIYEKYVYNLIELKNKYIFKYNNLPQKFIKIL